MGTLKFGDIRQAGLPGSDNRNRSGTGRVKYRQSGRTLTLNAGKRCMHDNDLAMSPSKSEVQMLVLIGGRSAGSEKWEYTRGRLASADWQMLEAWLIRRRGVGEVVGKEWGKTRVANRQP